MTEASVEVFDIYGKRISANTFATNEAGTISSMLQLPLNISPGVYVVNISAGDVHLAERLMVE